MYKVPQLAAKILKIALSAKTQAVEVTQQLLVLELRDNDSGEVLLDAGAAHRSVLRVCFSCGPEDIAASLRSSGLCMRECLVT